MGEQSKARALSVDDYIEAFPPDVQAVLETLRALARRVLPEAEEAISYGIPAYRVGGTDIVYFAGWQRHTSLYPIPAVSEAVELRLKPYRAGRGTLRFGLGEPLPTDLIESIIQLLADQRRPA
jgi:uncharacterized protein YdhG (YjbR/CyaY superfamily)